MQTQVNEIVPAISKPVTQLREKFTLQGQPLPVSTCMKALGLELDVQDGNHFYFWPDDGKPDSQQYCLIYSGDHWESAKYKAGDAEFNTNPISEAEMLSVLIRRYYKLQRAKKAQVDMNVLCSLSERLIQVATNEQLDTLRRQIKDLYV